MPFWRSAAAARGGTGGERENLPFQCHWNGIVNDRGRRGPLQLCCNGAAVESRSHVTCHMSHVTCHMSHVTVGRVGGRSAVLLARGREGGVSWRVSRDTPPGPLKCGRWGLVCNRGPETNRKTACLRSLLVWGTWTLPGATTELII